MQKTDKSSDKPSWILTLTCRDRVGIVAGVAGFLAGRGGFILDSQQYADTDTGQFFMRVVFDAGDRTFPAETDELRRLFTPVADNLGLNWALHASDERPRILIAVSKASHCLYDLLHRARTGGLTTDVAGVVSNHPDLKPLADWHNVPFCHLPVSNENRVAQEQEIEALMQKLGADYLVLARYMQILTTDFAERLSGRCINIHHSFLPGFKGARPYHRAHARGVKLIGATAHFVTADLDEGPIIEQAVERVDHRASANDLIRIGRDIESHVLAQAVNAAGDRRLFLNDGKTVVFR